MVVQRDKLVSEIRALSEEDKLRLLDVILNELDKPDPEIDHVWVNEARKRWSAYKEGRLLTISYEELMNSYRRLSFRIVGVRHCASHVS